MKKTRLIAVILVILFVVSSICAGAGAVENQTALDEYYDIVERISEKYGIDIYFSPNENINVSLLEFEEIIETYAMQAYTDNAYATLITKRIESQATVAPNSIITPRALGPERVSKTTSGYKVSANAYYRYNEANNIYLYASGDSVQVVAASFLSIDYFTIDSSSCSAIDLGRTLYVTATGTANRYNADLGWFRFPDTRLVVEIYYTALSANK